MKISVLLVKTVIDYRICLRLALRRTGYLSVMAGLCKQKVFSGELGNDAIQFQAQ
jgi:hypothetical protein